MNNYGKDLDYFVDKRNRGSNIDIIVAEMRQLLFNEADIRKITNKGKKSSRSRRQSMRSKKSSKKHSKKSTRLTRRN